MLYAAVLLGLVSAPPLIGNGNQVLLPLRDFHVIPSESGPVSYYSLVRGSSGEYIHAAYVPGLATVVVGYTIPEKLRLNVARVRWRWRALKLPEGGNECVAGKGDSAAVVYLVWRRFLRWYSVKYVWSSVAPKGATCDSSRSLFRAQDTVIVESGGPLGEWRSVEINPDKEFRAHFAHGDPNADVPALGGIGIMSDGDQTHSSSAADYSDFVIDCR
jgi:hypothetical protein